MLGSPRRTAQSNFEDQTCFLRNEHPIFIHLTNLAISLIHSAQLYDNGGSVCLVARFELSNLIAAYI